MCLSFFLVRPNKTPLASTSVPKRKRGDAFYIFNSRISCGVIIEKRYSRRKKLRVAFQANFAGVTSVLKRFRAIYPAFTRHRNPSLLSNYLDTLRLMRAIARESRLCRRHRRRHRRVFTYRYKDIYVRVYNSVRVHVELASRLQHLVTNCPARFFPPANERP